MLTSHVETISVSEDDLNATTKIASYHHYGSKGVHSTGREYVMRESSSLIVIIVYDKYLDYFLPA
jgi:hypothetical protein